MYKSGVHVKSNLWTVEFDEVLLVTDSTGNFNYTFRVTHPDAKPDDFYNLVLTENVEKDIYTVKLVRYKMTPTFASRFYTGMADIGEFAGTITFTPIAGGGQITPLNPPGSEPDPEPVMPEDPCEDEVTIEIPDNPGTAPGPGGPSGGSEGFDPNGNGAGIIPHFTGSLKDCWSVRYVKCSAGNPHYGNDPDCNADFKGATFLVNECTGENHSIYGRSSDDFGIQQDPCHPLGNIGVLFPYHLWIDPNFSLNFPCQANVVVDAYSVCSDLNTVFLNAFAGSDTHSVTYTNSATLGPNAETDFNPADMTVNPDGSYHFRYTIYIRDSYLTTATDLSIARTAIHENLHAILNFLRHTGVIVPSQQNPTFEQLLNTYANYLVQNGAAASQHEFMSQFVSDIAATLKAYGVDKGYNLPDSFYNAMAWGSLTHVGQAESTWFITLVPDPLQRNQIMNTLVAEQNNQTTNGVAPTSSPTSCNP